VALAAVIAAIPLIAVVGLGAEAGSWYVTKQHAQNAADAAAYSGALKLACSLGAASGTPCADAQSVDTRAKQFAAQNDFCDGRNAKSKGTPACPSYLPTGTSQTVVIDQPTSWNGTSGSFVRAVVNQTQPTFLVSVLGLSTLTIGAQAIAKVDVMANPCILALNGPISFQGSPDIEAPGCSMASNSTANNALDFTGNGMTINTSLSAAGGCTPTTSTFCQKSLTYMPPVTNPFSILDTIGSGTNHTLTQQDLGLSTSSKTCPNSQLIAYSAAARV